MGLVDVTGCPLGVVAGIPPSGCSAEIIRLSFLLRAYVYRTWGLNWKIQPLGPLKSAVSGITSESLNVDQACPTRTFFNCTQKWRRRRATLSPGPTKSTSI